MFYLIPI
ncbi:unnamed protein product, partial [Allacma fusca]